MWFVLACASEQGFHKPADGGEGEDTAVTSPVCEDETIAGFDGSINKDCVNEIATGVFTPVVEWTLDAFPGTEAYAHVMMTPVVVSLTDDDADGDIDEHDTPDIVTIAYSGSSWTGDGVIRAVSGDGSGIHWERDDLNIQGSGAVAAGDIDGDGLVEIVLVDLTNRALALNHDGTTLWISKATVAAGCNPAAPAISDMNSDGSPEIVIGNTILNADGTLRAVGGGSGACTSVPVDLDGDGAEEVVVGEGAFDIDGNWVLNTVGGDGYIAVADFNSDGVGDIVSNTGTVSVYSGQDGGLLFTSSYVGSGPPTVADFDGDGAPEIGVAGTSTYTVVDTDGSTLWQNTTTDGSSGRTGSAVFDFEGDGAAEVVYADETRLWVFAGPDGAVKLEDKNHTSWTWIEYAAIADVDGDDHAEIVVPNGGYAGTSSGFLGIAVIGDGEDSWQPGRRIWNQHAYHITNINDDGSVPVTADRNWLTYNNFRSGDVGAGSGTQAPDLVVEVAEICDVDCDAGVVAVQAHPGNIGFAASEPGAELELFADLDGVQTLLATVEIPSLPAGTYSDAVLLEAMGLSFEVLDNVEVIVNTSELECLTDNNVAIVDVVCP